MMRRWLALAALMSIPATALAGYKVYVGTSSRKYQSNYNAGKATQYTVGPLKAGTYYFSVTSFDSSGNESSYSTEVSYQVQ